MNLHIYNKTLKTTFKQQQENQFTFMTTSQDDSFNRYRSLSTIHMSYHFKN